MKKGAKVEKVKKYTEPILVRFDKQTKLMLQQKALEREMNEAVYCRKAIELCIKKKVI